jgi:hypothetical protein
MPDSQFVENIGVEDGQIADHHIRLQNQGEHVGPDVARIDDFAGRAPGQLHRIEHRVEFYLKISGSAGGSAQRRRLESRRGGESAWVAGKNAVG